MAQETDSDSDGMPLGRPGGDDDDIFFVPVMAKDVDIDAKRPTITPETANLMNANTAANGGSGGDRKFDSDDENDDGTEIVQYDADEKQQSSHHKESYSRGMGQTNPNDANIQNQNQNNNNNNNNNNTSNQSNPELNSFISEPPLARVDQNQLSALTSEPPQQNGKIQRANHPLSDNNLGLPKQQHHNKDSTIGYSISSDFVRDTKWDVVYLTSSPLVFGSGTYKPLDQLNIKEEREQFFSTLRSSGKALKVIHNPATTSNIIAAVTGGSKCIHYSGHGYPNYLAFEDAKRIGETHLVHYDLIRRVCEDEDQRIEFVFASACHSEHVGQAFIEAGIPHVVAVKKKWEVTDEAAACFTKHFYDTLLNGFTIAKAFHTAKNAVGAMSSSARLDATKFLLLPEDSRKENNRHNVTLFDMLKKGTFIDDTKPTPPNNLPPAVQQFVGRAIDMRHIIHKLMDNGVRLLILTGDHGIGKSATSLMVARYFCDRRMFKGGLFFIDVPKMANSTDGKENMPLSQMLLRAFRESGDEMILEKFGKDGDLTESEIFNKMRHMGEMLLVFDGLDDLNIGPKIGQNGSSGNGSNGLNSIPNSSMYGGGSTTNRLLQTQAVIQSFLQNVFDRTNVDTKVLVTSEKKQHTYADFTGCISRFYQLRPLKSKDAAILFSRLANQFRHTDIVSHSRLMHLLECNPLKISQVVQLKHQFNCDTLEKIVDAFETKQKIQSHPQALALSNYNQRKKEKRRKRQELAERHITDIRARNVWLRAKGMETVPYHELFEQLEVEFIEFTGSQRKLNHTDLMEPCKSFGLNLDLTYPIEKFNNFFKWFDGLCLLVKVLDNIWNEMDPILVLGFVSRNECEQKLSTSMPGTFIIRFSMTSPKSIAISYREARHKHPVTHLKASLTPDQKFQFELRSEHTLRPMTLDDFVRKFKKIEYLYEDSQNTTMQPRHKSTLNFGPRQTTNGANHQSGMPTHMQIPQQTQQMTQQQSQPQQQQQQQQHYTMQNTMSYPIQQQQQQQQQAYQQQQQSMIQQQMYSHSVQQPYSHPPQQQQHTQAPPQQQYYQQRQQMIPQGYSGYPMNGGMGGMNGNAPVDSHTVDL